jgi:hypothetical protein
MSFEKLGFNRLHFDPAALPVGELAFEASTQFSSLKGSFRQARPKAWVCRGNEKATLKGSFTFFPW